MNTDRNIHFMSVTNSLAPLGGIVRFATLSKKEQGGKRSLLILTLITISLMASAQSLRLPHFFADGMVLQRDAKNPIWGWGKAGETVSVTFNGKTVNAVVKGNGTWKVYLPKMKANATPQTMSVTSVDRSPLSVVIKNILIGDVFLCSGQSNMELPIRRCMDVVADKVKDYSNDNIRYLKLPHQYNYNHPNDDVNILPWQNITPQNCAEVSGICYFMARELQEKENVPIGIINSAVGGTRVEAWMPQDVLATFPAYKDEFKKQKYTQVDWTDSVARAENKRAYEWERLAMATDTVVNRWNKPGYDFKTWKTVDIFGDWFNGNGSYWFRCPLQLPQGVEGKAAVLRVGAMKDADTVYVNGQYVGNTTYEYPPRIYKIPAGLLKEGENEIMVHLISQSGRGNFTKGKLYQIEISPLTTPPLGVGGIGIHPDSIIQLAPPSGDGGLWQMCQGSKMQPKPGSTYFVDGNTGLYNAMIAPFKDIQLKGILWYQGESNQGNTKDYAAYLTAMVKSWRKQFGKDYPVVIMQLPGYQSHHDQPHESGWTQIREQQYIAAQQIPNAGLAPTLDTGEYNDIHPQDKATAGHRAALQMEHLAYNKKGVSTGPCPVSAKIKDGKAIITFSKETGKLRVPQSTKGEAIQNGANGISTIAIKVGDKFQWAEAKVTGDYTIAVTLPTGLEGINNLPPFGKDGVGLTIRYCWDDYPTPTIYNVEGIPAPQFQICTK